ncbi:MAG: SAM-dependent methyltransferase [Treponema sp.]
MKQERLFSVQGKSGLSVLLPPSVQPIAGKIWIPAAGFEQHLYAELHTVTDGKTSGTTVIHSTGSTAASGSQDSRYSEKPVAGKTGCADAVLSPEQAAAFFSATAGEAGSAEVPYTSAVYVITENRQESELKNSEKQSGSRQKSRKRNTASSPTGTVLHRLVYSKTPPPNAFWTQLCFEQPFIAQFGSITEAAALLRSIQRNWIHYPLSHFRRASLITGKLPYIHTKPRIFPSPLPLTDIGVWSLLDAHTLIASAKTSSPFPLGCAHFCEDHVNPPSRAYLKLWEALTLLDYYYRKAQAAHTDPLPADWVLPQQGSHCIDAGACPGGWTWVLRKLGAAVTAIDRSPLAEPLMRDSAVTFLKHDAFTLSPAALGKQDWVCSDVICYPPRLLDWVTQWRQSGLCSKFICTIKMQGTPDTETVSKFAAIPHSKILHLRTNKHELTWLCAPFIQ